MARRKHHRRKRKVSAKQRAASKRNIKKAQAARRKKGGYKKKRGKKRGYKNTKKMIVKRPRQYARRSRYPLVSRPFLIRHRSRSMPGKVTDRLAVVVKVGRRRIAFYQSTGTGTPGVVRKGEWIPFNGISRQGGGWFIKAPGKVPTGTLKEAALSLEGRVGAPTRVFDNRGLAAGEHNADVNSYLERHGALQHDVDREEAGPFAIKTVNFRR